MKPAIWGPTAWIYLHLISLSYPDNPTRQDIDNNKFFLEYFGKTLPCSKCKNNFKNHLKSFNINYALRSKTNYIDFIWKLHNKVNEDLNKNKLAFNNFIAKYKNIIDSGYHNSIQQIETINLYRKIIIFLIIIIIITLFYNVVYRKN
tara:strand:+ start:230 stop:670 length:441 start_codon:yes stop_codon:yes gene_type:complete